MSFWLKKSQLAVITFVSILAFVGCSLRSTALKFADTIFQYQIDQAFDLNDDQNKVVEPAIADLIDWIKNNKKESIIKLLRMISSLSKKDRLDTADVEKIRIEARQLLSEVGGKLAPVFEEIIPTLSDKQLKQFSDYMTESNERFDEMLASDDFEAERKEELENRLENIYGDITPDQLNNTVAHTLDKKRFKAYLKQRKISQKYCLEKLRSLRKRPSGIKVFVTNLFLYPENLRPIEHKLEYLELRKKWNSFWVKSDSIMTKKQRIHAKEVIEDLIADIQNWD